MLVATNVCGMSSLTHSGHCSWDTCAPNLSVYAPPSDRSSWGQSVGDADTVLIAKGLIGGLFQVALFAALLLIPAGTWEWPRAIQFLIGYGVVVEISTVALAIANPASLEARLEGPVSRKQPMADRIATGLLIAAILGWFIFIPIDVFHLQLLPTPSLVVSVFGAMIGLAGYCIVMIALYQNQFAVPIVRDQSERGHALVDTGLYGIVRHPFYAGFLAMFAGIGLWLESYASVVALLVVLAALVFRMMVEEDTLRDTLPGYVEYMSNVRYRLLPFVW